MNAITELFSREDIALALPPPDSFELLFASHELDDELPLDSQGVREGAEIEIVLHSNADPTRHPTARRALEQVPHILVVDGGWD